MSRFRLLYRRLLERRLLGDGEGAASMIPGASVTLGLSLLLFSLIVPERSLFQAQVLLMIACFTWAATRAFLESHDLDAAALDRAVLEPLPIPRMMLAAARALVIAVVLLIMAFNVALPAAVLLAYRWNVSTGLLALVGAFLAALTGLALAQIFRVVLERFLGLQRLEEMEGPIRLGVGVALFGLLFAAPDPTAFVERNRWVEALPPFSYAALAVPDGKTMSLAWALLGGVGSALILLLAFRLSLSSAGQATGRKRVAGPSAPGRLVRRLFVRPEERASFDFALANASRDRTFRTRVYPLFAFPFAVILLVASRPDDPFLALMALYGAAVYLILAQTFQGYTESVGGPDLLKSLPLRDVAAFRIGAEKAFLVGLAAPIFIVLAVALGIVSLMGRGMPLLLGLQHALMAGLFAQLLCALLFERRRELAFGETDRGVYPADLGALSFTAILIAAVMAFIASGAAGKLIPFVAVVAALCLALRLTFAWKRRRDGTA